MENAECSPRNVFHSAVLDHESNVAEHLRCGTPMAQSIRRKSLADDIGSVWSGIHGADTLADEANLNESFFVPQPFSIASELGASLQVARSAKKESLWSSAIAKIDALVNSEDRLMNRPDFYIGWPLPGWGNGYVRPGMWVCDLPTSAAISLQILTFSNELNQRLSRKQSATMSDLLARQAAWISSALYLAPWGLWLSQGGKPLPVNQVAIACRFIFLFGSFSLDDRYRAYAGRLSETIFEIIKTAGGRRRGKIPYNPAAWRGAPGSSLMIDGEKYWKSPPVFDLLITVKETNPEAACLLDSLTKGLIHWAEAVPLKDSIAADTGVELSQDRIRYHASKGQYQALQRFYSFYALGHHLPGVVEVLDSAAVANPFLIQFAIDWKKPSCYWVLEGLTARRFARLEKEET